VGTAYCGANISMAPNATNGPLWNQLQVLSTGRSLTVRATLRISQSPRHAFLEHATIFITMSDKFTLNRRHLVR
jgi:hypothetical protein